MSRAIVIALVLLCTRSLHAVDVRVRLEVKDPGCRQGTLLVAIDERGERITTPVLPDQDAYTISLQGGQTATVVAEHARCWSDRAFWSASDAGTVVVALHPAARIGGRFDGPHARAVRDVRGYVHLHDSAGDSNALPQPAVANSSCDLADGVWQCSVPANVAFDFRLEIPRFAAHHFWDVTVPAARVHQVEPQPLVAGATITGWVVSPADAPIGAARVSVTPEAAPSRERERAANRQTVRTNRRGHFQFAGLPAGTYRIVSQAPALAAAVVPQINVAEGEKVTLPRAIRHAPHVELEVVVEPPLDRTGQRWTVEVAEASPLYAGRAPEIVSGRVEKDGRWVARRLRPDAYKLTILDGSRGIAHTETVDMFDGGPGTLAVRIEQIVLRGRVRAGDEPLEADLHLWSREGGRLVKTSSDPEGRFEVVLPSAGRWEPTVFYPRGAGAAEIAAEPFDVAKDSGPDGHHVDVDLPGARIDGKVVTGDGKTVAAIVRALTGARVAAQQKAGPDGVFDFLGLSPGTYRLEAVADAGATPHPVDVVIGDDDSRTVTLVVEPYAMLDGYVLTADGRPASGAVVHFFDGRWWKRLLTDVKGRFRDRLRAGTANVQLVVLTYDHAAALLATAVTSEPIRVQLRRDGGEVRFHSPTILIARGVRAPVQVMRFRSDGPFSGSLLLETGAYTVCPVNGAADQCRSLTVVPSSRQEVTFSTNSPPTGGTS